VDGEANIESNVSGTGTINTENGGIVRVFGAIDGITHTGDDLSELQLYGTVGNITNESGKMELEECCDGGANLTGTLTNNSLGKIKSTNQIEVGVGTHLANDGLVEGDLMVASGGSLDGTGTIIGDLYLADGGRYINDGTTGTFDVFGDLTLEGLMQFEVAGLDSSLFEYDQFLIQDDLFTDILEGNAFLDGTIGVLFLDNFMPKDGDFLDLIIAEVINDINLSFIFDLDQIMGLNYSYEVMAYNGNDVLRLSFLDDPVSVPAPAAIWLFGIGMVGLGFARRKQRSDIPENN